MRRAGRAVLWAVAAGLVLFTGLRISGLDLGWPVVAALAFTPYMAVGSLVPLATAAAVRAWRPLAVVSACTVVLAILVVPRMLPATAPPAGGPPLRVMTVNLYGGAGDTGTVVELVRRHRVDVLTVLELTGSDAGRLATAGIDALLPHQRLLPGDSVEGSGIYARFPLSPAADLERDSRFEMPAVRLRVPGADPVELLAVHPVPPVAGQIASWRHELRTLPPATPDGPVRVLAGDFNATLDHAPLRALIASGYADAGDATGAGLVGTWRDLRPVGRLLPAVPIDRVLVDPRVAVNDLSVHPIPGSDHRSVIAHLTLPAGSAHSLRAVSGPVIRRSSGSVAAMTPSATARPATTIR
ncbi:MAG: endonuclease/exonuclease/phosphatase family protein [Natronosporangium sp.]